MCWIYMFDNHNLISVVAPAHQPDYLSDFIPSSIAFLNKRLTSHMHLGHMSNRPASLVHTCMHVANSYVKLFSLCTLICGFVEWGPTQHSHARTHARTLLLIPQ